jgi:hypothetical protein
MCDGKPKQPRGRPWGSHSDVVELRCEVYSSSFRFIQGEQMGRTLGVTLDALLEELQAFRSHASRRVQ